MLDAVGSRNFSIGTNKWQQHGAKVTSIHFHTLVYTGTTTVGSSAESVNLNMCICPNPKVYFLNYTLS